MKKEAFWRSKSDKSKIVRSKGKIPPEAEDGIVVASLGKTFLVRPAEGSNSPVECRVAGILISKHEKSSLTAVGDRVKFVRERRISEDTGLPTGSIVAVEERLTILSRRAPGKKPREHVIAANADILLVFMAATGEGFNRRLLDRYLVAAEQGELEPIICINKIDLVDMEEIREVMAPYHDLGYDVIYMSALSGQGVDELTRRLADKECVLSGPSGAGKSTLVNRLLGEEIQQVYEISERTSKGRHTTSFVRMFDLEGGGAIIDTPGIREFGLWAIEPEELSLYFHEFDEFRHECRFIPCTHTHEPGCAVKDAVETCEIDFGRYESYCFLLETIVTGEYNS
ncbi:MAG: ribosome small subunit-dependent GTPase A [Candidatus Kapaibacterium sp.]